jgi:membrane associated rhomboid family serine protease
MFGTELERVWGSRYFVEVYFVTGIGAGVLIALSRCCRSARQYSCMGRTSLARRVRSTVSCSRTLYFPDRPIYIPALPDSREDLRAHFRAIAFYASLSGAGGGVANATHLGGLLVAYLYLKAPRSNLLGESGISI